MADDPMVHRLTDGGDEQACRRHTKDAISKSLTKEGYEAQVVQPGAILVWL